MRYRLSKEARADIAAILRTSETLHGEAARVRYRGLITATLRRIAYDPDVAPSIDRSAFAPGLRSMHTVYGRDQSREARVAAPVHVVYYKALDVHTIAIVRVLHERTDPAHRLDAAL